MQGYQVIRNDNLATLEIENSIQKAIEVIEIQDDSESNQASDSDAESINKDDPIAAGIENWLHNTQASQAPLQYYDLETRKWMSKEEDLSEEFLGKLRGAVGDLDNNSPDHRNFAEQDMNIPQNTHKDRELANKGHPVALPVGNQHTELMNLDELCADVMNMHRNDDITQVHERRDMDTDYEFSWTGM